MPSAPTAGSESGATVNSCSPRISQRLAAGDEHLEVWALPQERRQVVCGRHDLLEVVEHQQHLAAAELFADLGEHFFAAGHGHAHGPDNRVERGRGVMRRREIHEYTPSGKRSIASAAA